jgi:FAD/FMN-containing dehydrogenase
MTSLTISPAGFAGAFHRPGDAGYHDARRAWNLAVDQRPAAVAHATGAADVQAAVAFARDAGLRVVPQATGHGAAALGGAQDGALLLKTSGMDGIAIDAASRTARVEAGALSGDLAVRAGADGLAALQGSSIDVSVVGYTLGGGIGWRAREHGLACDDVTAIELVTADGALRRLDADSTGEDGELFWALRGGGGSFGVVTALEFGLQPLRDVYAGSLFWPGDAAREILHAYREWAASVPDTVTSSIRLLRLPDLPAVPAPLRATPVIDLCLAFTGDEAEGEALVRPLREAVAPLIDTLATVPAPQLAKIHGDPEQPVPGSGHHTLLRELTSAGIDALVEVAGHASGSPLLGVELRQLGGALARRAPGAGSLGPIDAGFLLYAVGVPVNPQVGEAVRERLDAVVAAMAPWATGGAFLNFADRPGEETARGFTPAAYARLQAVKRAVDPAGLFLANHEVEPA